MTPVLRNQIALTALAATACQPVEEGRRAAGPAASASSPGPVFDAVRADETIRFTGTEPFWGGEVAEDQLIYRTPENQAGEPVPVQRFAGNNGLGFSGTLGGKPFDLAITPGSCSDGMSDRTYPYTATLRVGEEQRTGCAWTDRQPFSGSQQP